MKIIVDAFGGDNAPIEIIKGAVNAVKNLGIEVVLVGKTEIMEKVFAKFSLSKENIEFVDAQEVVTMEDDPVAAVRSKKDSSLVVGAKLLADGMGDAFVSAGNTGAVLTAATLIVKRINGVKRPALAPVIPTSTGVSMLIDCGANVTCTPEFLVQFAQMGSIYMSEMFGIHNPRVGLLNNGVEECKGTQLQVDTYKLLKDSPINFVGNVEAKEFMLGACDVLTCDGFTGNILLKSIEGTAKMIMKEVKGLFYKSILTKIGALTVKSGVSVLKKKMDVSEYGGVPLMGVSKPVIKAHGSSNDRAIESAIAQAIKYKKSGMIEKIEEKMAVKIKNPE